ncbi:hypothetical protein [Aromatoleum aromaticum]|nr:hypothetical protein [Aromatoleum aromaticum]
MQEKIAKFESLVAGGMRPGRAARRVFSGSDAEIQSLAQLAGLRFSVSGDYSAFEAAYHDVRSCMQGKGALCHQFYSLLGVVIATLADERGVIVARALLAGHLFYQVYGDNGRRQLAWPVDDNYLGRLDLQPGRSGSEG